MTSHPERKEEMQPICVYCDRVLACDHCGMEQPYDDLSVLKAKLTAAEKRVEEAERERDEVREVLGKVVEALKESRVMFQEEIDGLEENYRILWKDSPHLGEISKEGQDVIAPYAAMIAKIDCALTHTETDALRELERKKK